MSTSLGQRFVHIIESPSANDLLDDRTEGRLLKESLKLAEIPTSYRLASSRETLSKALYRGLIDDLKKRPNNSLPILHLSAHGNKEGIVLTNEEFVSWEDLRTLLVPINKVFAGSLIFCLSACEGYGAVRSAMNHSKELPYFALVSHLGATAWADAAIGFSTFYHLLLKKNKSINDILPAMRLAAGDDGFVCKLGEETRQDWIKYVHENSLREAYANAIGRLTEATPD
jgi:hypothetical protein